MWDKITHALSIFPSLRSTALTHTWSPCHWVRHMLHHLPGGTKDWGKKKMCKTLQHFSADCWRKTAIYLCVNSVQLPSFPDCETENCRSQIGPSYWTCAILNKVKKTSEIFFTQWIAPITSQCSCTLMASIVKVYVKLLNANCLLSFPWPTFTAFFP